MTIASKFALETANANVQLACWTLDAWSIDLDNHKRRNMEQEHNLFRQTIQRQALTKTDNRQTNGEKTDVWGINVVRKTISNRITEKKILETVATLMHSQLVPES